MTFLLGLLVGIIIFFIVFTIASIYVGSKSEKEMTKYFEELNDELNIFKKQPPLN